MSEFHIGTIVLIAGLSVMQVLLYRALYWLAIVDHPKIRARAIKTIKIVFPLNLLVTIWTFVAFHWWIGLFGVPFLLFVLVVAMESNLEGRLGRRKSRKADKTAVQ